MQAETCLCLWYVTKLIWRVIFWLVKILYTPSSTGVLPAASAAGLLAAQSCISLLFPSCSSDYYLSCGVL